MLWVCNAGAPPRKSNYYRYHWSCSGLVSHGYTQIVANRSKSAFVLGLCGYILFYCSPDYLYYRLPVHSRQDGRNWIDLFAFVWLIWTWRNSADCFGFKSLSEFMCIIIALKDSLLASVALTVFLREAIALFNSFTSWFLSLAKIVKLFSSCLHFSLSL
jgi:hypothetical protein